MIKVKLASYDTSLGQTDGLDFFHATKVENHHVKELRMSKSLFERLTEQPWFFMVLDPVSRVSDLELGYVGVLYGMNITLWTDIDHPRILDLPDDQIIVFYEEADVHATVAVSK